MVWVRRLLWSMFALVVLGICAIGGVIYYTIAMPGATYQGPEPTSTAAQQALAQRLQRHVSTIAAHEHHLGEPAALAKVVSYLEQQLGASGLKVNKRAFNTRDGTAHNLEVVIPGRSNGVLVVGAHYDSARGAQGANDNGSGVAAVLELAQMLSQERPQHAIHLVLFANEEPPYFQTMAMGSLVYAGELKAAGRQMIGMLSLETLGYYDDAPGSQRYPEPFNHFYPDRGNFVAFVGDWGSRAWARQSLKAFRRHAQIPSEGVAAPAAIRGIGWSDHWSFWQHGIPAVMVTDTAVYRYPYYHSEFDTPDKVHYPRLAQVVTALRATLLELAND